MRILQITLGFLPAVGWGGPVKVVHRTSEELIRRGHDVTVYCSNLFDKRNKIQPGTFERDFEGIRVVYFNTWNLPFWPGTLGPMWLPDLSSFLKREMKNFDVVHINGYRTVMNLPVVRAARDAGIPIVLQPHGTMQVIVNTLWAKHVYDRVFGPHELKGISKFIAMQESERKQIMSYAIPSEKIEIISSGLDTSNSTEFPEAGGFRRKYNVPADAPLILFLGRINRKKGADMLVEAFQQLENKEAWLAIAGPDDGQLHEVTQMVLTYRLENRVVMPGLLTGTDVWSAYQDADIFVLPCRTDTSPSTILEACLAGTPMVVTDRCEIAYMVKDRISTVVPFEAESFAAAIDELLADTEKYAAYRANCHKMMEDTFSLKLMVDRLEALYQRASTNPSREALAGDLAGV